MNPEMPPLPFEAPSIRKRRQQSHPVPPIALLTTDQRREISIKVIEEKSKIDRKFQSLTPEQKRAIILKIKHDRPLNLKDLSGTNLRFLGEPGDDESLVYSKDDNLDKLANRARDLEAGRIVSLNKDPGLLSKMVELDIADPKERLSEEFCARYEEMILDDHVVYEIEISIPTQGRESTKRRKLDEIVFDIRDSLGRGINGHIYDIDYQGDGAILMVGTKGGKLKEFVEDEKWWRRISRFELRPKFKTMSQVFNDFSVGKVSVAAPPDDAEVICVVDSGIAIGNPFLGPVTKQEISRSWVYGASPNEDACGHGSGVSSLAAFYSISFEEGGQNQASAWVTSARIMTDDGELDSPRLDDLSEDRIQQAWLLSRILREIVEHFVPHGVRIFVLAFEMQGHIWSHATRRQVARNAWIARTLDQLCREYDIVFVGITGNVAPIEADDISGETQSEYPHYLLHSFAKLLDPGPSALSVICGSLAHSTHLAGGSHVLVAGLDQPSPFTRSGPGFADAIKPDVVEYGGSFARDSQSGRIVSNPGTNVVMASNGLTPALKHAYGTSYAAPRVANHLAKILGNCRTLGVEPSATLLRAFLAVSCKQPSNPGDLPDDQMLALVGYGRPDGDSAMLCRGNSVLLYWDGSVEVDSAAIFKIHVPPQIVEAGRGRKTITVAVASAPPVQNWGLGEYLGASVKFWLYRGDVDPSAVGHQHQRELNQDNVPTDRNEDAPGVLGVNRRSQGTLQREVFRWSIHQPEFCTHDYSLVVMVAQSARWLKRDDQKVVPLSVVIRLEDEAGICQQLYSQVRARLRVST